MKLYKKNDDGVKEAAGVLTARDAQTITVTADGVGLQLQKSDVASVKADDDKDLFGGNKKK